MSSDKFQDKYQEALQDLKKEIMDWDFDDFLKKTEETTPIIPIEKPEPGISRYFWMAAGVAALFCLGIYLVLNSQNKSVEANLVKNEILKQKTSITAENTYSEDVVEDSAQAKKDSAETENSPLYQSEEKILNQILPKRGRLRKSLRPRYADNTHQNNSSEKIQESPSEKTEYHPDYVIVNGKKLYNEDEAVETTKKALSMFANNLNYTLQEAQPLKKMNEEF